MKADLLLVLWEMGCWSTAVAGKVSQGREQDGTLEIKVTHSSSEAKCCRNQL